MIAPPILLFALGLAIIWAIKGFAESSVATFRRSLWIAAGSIGACVVAAIILIAWRQNDWIPVKQEMSDAQVGIISPDQRLAKCMLQQLRGQPQGAIVYAFTICGSVK